MNKKINVPSETRIEIKLTDEYSIKIDGKTLEEASSKIFKVLSNHTGTFDPETHELEMANISKFSWDDFPNGLSLEEIKNNEKNGVKQKYETPYRKYEVKVTVYTDGVDNLIASGVEKGKTWCPTYMCSESV